MKRSIKFPKRKLVMQVNLKLEILTKQKQTKTKKSKRIHVYIYCFVLFLFLTSLKFKHGTVLKSREDTAKWKTLSSAHFAFVHFG